MRLKNKRHKKVAIKYQIVICVLYGTKEKGTISLQWWLDILVVYETKEKNHRFVNIKFVKNGHKKRNGATQQVTRASQKVWLRAKPTRLRLAP